MSHHSLQHALVIALHDETFVAEMARDAEATLAPLGLTGAEIASLRGVDPRAFRTDPLRKRRTLRILSEELRASTTLALAETRSLAFVERFFSSPEFRRAVLERRPLALAFGDYLGRAEISAPLYREIVRLESMLARCRRELHQLPAPGLALAPGVAAGAFDAATLPAVQALESYVFELALMPQAAMCDDHPPPPVARPSGEIAHLLVTPSGPSGSGVSLSTIDAALHKVLAVFRAPLPPERAPAALAAAGVDAARAGDLVSSLVDEGLLTATPTG